MARTAAGVRNLHRQGKGSHYRVRFGDRITTIQSGELTNLRLKTIRKQLGIDDAAPDALPTKEMCQVNYVFHARLEPDPDGGFLVTFPDVPEAITGGDDEAEAKHNAVEALGLALRGILALGRGCRSLPPRERGLVPIAVDTADALKLALIEAFKAAGISKRSSGVGWARPRTRRAGSSTRIIRPNWRRSKRRYACSASRW